MELVFTLASLPEVTKSVLAFSEGISVWTLEGEMGAGKTTFIKEVCRQLGSEDQVSSPTFSIVNEYASGTGAPLFHFDFYRIKSSEEALDIGYEEYFYSGNYCFVEWPSRVRTLLPEAYLEILLLPLDGEKRKITVQRRKIA